MISRFKNWLKKSGIKHVRMAGRFPFEGQEMIDSLNPLEEVIEHSQYPMARIYRESLWTGIKDTFNVLVGNHHDMERRGKSRKGVLDLLIFPVIGRRLMGFTNYNLEDHMFLSLMVGIIGIIFEMSRIMLGGLLTLALTPIVAIVHACAYFKKKKLRENLRYLRVVAGAQDLIAKVTETQVLPSGEIKDSKLIAVLPREGLKVYGEGTLPLCLLERNSRIGLVDQKEAPIKSESVAKMEEKEEHAKDFLLDALSARPVVARAAAQEHKEYVPSEMCYLSIRALSIDNHTQMWFLAKINERNASAISALLATNTANILNHLDQEDLQKLQQYVKKSPDKAAREMFCNGSSKSVRNASPLYGLFHSQHFHAEPILSCIFDMAGIANEVQERISRNPETSPAKNREAR
jgi:hypothetical protein